MSELRDWFLQQDVGGLSYEDFKPAYRAGLKASVDEADAGNQNVFEIARKATLATLLAYRDHVVQGGGHP